MQIGIYPNTRKEAAMEAARELINWMQERGVAVFLPTEAAQLLDRQEWGMPNPPQSAVSILLSLGGDGTLLSAARWVAGTGIPILGVNLGHLGFLTSVTWTQLQTSLERLLTGGYTSQSRLMIAVHLIRNGEEIYRGLALNDVTICKGIISRIIRVRVSIEGHYFTTYRGDGLIISTPTGSTGYTLSAGGPLVNPALEVMLITPICAHTLGGRPLVIGHQEHLEALVEATHDELYLTIDGQESVRLQNEDRIMIAAATERTILASIEPRPFYEVVRQHFLDHTDELSDSNR